jgi:Flp pilus assembly protein TadD
VQAAMAYARAGNPAAAQELYSRALAAAPTNPRLLHSWAKFQLQQGDTAGAESALSQLEAVEPGNGYLCYLRGVLAQQQGELGSARGWFSKGLRYTGEVAAGGLGLPAGHT